MSYDHLAQTDDLTAAAWIAPRLGAFAGGVSGVIPRGFEAYARILHPASADGEWVRWSEVAVTCGKVAHPLMQFHTLVGLSPYEHDVTSGAWEGTTPDDGELEPQSLEALLDVLARHTTTPDPCWFCLWEGYGWITGAVQTVTFTWAGPNAEADEELVENVVDRVLEPPTQAESRSQHELPSIFHGARLELPSRKYLLFSGPLDAATELGHSPSPEWFLPQSPNIFWPDDVAWCVATEIDLFCTYVGGSRELIDELLADERLEVWEAHLDDPVAHDSDVLNS